MRKQSPRYIPIDALRAESGSEELVNSESMKPYMELLVAAMGGRDTSRALAALAAIPLEQRYVWRVISALKWGLCDLETENVAVDIATLSEQDLKTVTEPLTLRAMQFSLFVKALVGDTRAREIMQQAISVI